MHDAVVAIWRDGFVVENLRGMSSNIVWTAQDLCSHVSYEFKPGSIFSFSLTFMMDSVVCEIINWIFQREKKKRSKADVFFFSSVILQKHLLHAKRR